MKLEPILIGVLLGAVPSSELARLIVAALGKRFGIKPQEIKQYNDATDNE